MEHVPTGHYAFPFLFGGTFIEGLYKPVASIVYAADFPSFSEGLSLRDLMGNHQPAVEDISLPFRRDFHWGSSLMDEFWYPVRIFPFLFGGTFIEGP